MKSISYADLWLEGRNDNSTTSVYYSQSVSSSAAYASIFDSAITSWNNISTKVSLKKVTSSSAGTFVYVSTTTTPGLI